MIFQVLGFLRDQLDAYLKLKYAITDGTTLIQLGNIAWHDTEDTASQDKSNAFISLVNIEEDRISKSSEKFRRDPGGVVVYKNPKIFLNLHLLFSANLSDYGESLKRLSYIIQFFQYQNVFTPLTTPGTTLNPFPAEVDELIFDLYTLSFQDLNNLWGIMGSKYLPSVLYKMRLIIIDENSITAEGSFIKSITVNSHQ
jgi:hypothetical protein